MHRKSGSISSYSQPNLEIKLKEHHKNNFKRKLKSKKFKRVFLTNTGIGLRYGLPIWFTFFLNLSFKYIIYFYGYALFKYVTGKRFNLVDDPYLVIHNHWSKGYHHWISEVLIKLLYLEESPNNVQIALPEDYPEFAFQSLEVFSFKRILKIPVDHQIFFKNLTLIDNPSSGSFNPKDIQKLREFFWKSYEVTPQLSSFLYISRKNMATRKIANESSLIPILKSLNFSIIQPEEYTFEQQVRIFSQCKVLVSIHGAGLTNCIFMPPNSIIFEFYRDVTDDLSKMNACFFNLAKAASLNYYVQFCQHTTNSSPKPNDASIQVDIDEFTSRINSIIHQ